MPTETPTPQNSGRKLLLDFGPLLVFFAVNLKWGILPATAVLVPASVVALVLSWKLEGKVSPIALYGTVALVVFGGLTLVLRDETFIKIKLTAIYVLFGGVLGVGLLLKKPLLRDLLGQSIRLDDEGWRRLTLRFTVFFFVLAGLNEVLRRVLSSDAWVTFKVFGVTGLTFLFTVFQAPLFSRHSLDETKT